MVQIFRQDTPGGKAPLRTLAKDMMTKSVLRVFIVLFFHFFHLFFVLPVHRGGGEYGEEWHSGGTLGNKQNVFDDFTAAARYLAAEGYTTKDQLAIMGGSNGGLVSVCACVHDIFGGGSRVCLKVAAMVSKRLVVG